MLKILAALLVGLALACCGAAAQSVFSSRLGGFGGAPLAPSIVSLNPSTASFTARTGNAGTGIGTLTTSVTLGTFTGVYALAVGGACTSSADNGSFTVSSAGAYAIGALDLTTARPYNICVSATDATFSNSPVNQTITLTGVAPATITSINPSNTNFTSQAGNAGTAIGTLTTSASGGSFAGAYALTTGGACTSSANNASFTVSPAGAYAIGPSDITAPGTYSICVAATDAAFANSPFKQTIALNGIAPSASITTSTYINNGAGAMPIGTPLLMAQAFRRGDVLVGSNCAVPRNAATHNPLIWQHDNTATRRENGDDGSVRHWTFGVLTDAVVAPGAKYTIEWVSTGAACPAQSAHQTLAGLAAAHDLKVRLTNVTNQDLTMRGSGSLTFSVNAAASNAGRDVPTKYATGPVYDGWRIAGPPTWDAASSGRLIGAQQSPAQQTLSSWTSITTGSFHVVVDGTARNVTGINLSSATNLTDVATLITARLSAASAGATMKWDGVDEISRFQLYSNSTGTSSTVSLLTAAGSGTDISGQLLMTAASASYNASVNAYTQAGVASGSADPLLYMVCYVDVTTQSNGTSMGKVRSVCGVYNSWMNVAAGTTGNAGNPGPAGYPNDPQTINYRPTYNDGAVALIDYGALFDASVTAASNPVFISGTTQGCSIQDFIGNCWKLPTSTGQVPLIRGGAHVYSCSPVGACTPPTCELNAAPHGTRTGAPCQYQNGHLYFDFPSGTSGGQGLDSTYVSFTDVQGTDVGFSVDPTNQGVGTHNFSYRTPHTHWMHWYTLAPDTRAPWSDGSAVSYSPWVPALDQGSFTGERRYWEQTGTIAPISLTQTTNVQYDFLNDGNYFYQPVGRGLTVGGGGAGDRPDLGLPNQFAAQAWITQGVNDWERQRNFSVSEGAYPTAGWLNEATGYIPAINNGPPTGPGGGGAGGSYATLGAPIVYAQWNAIGSPNNFAVIEALGGTPILAGGGKGLTDPMCCSYYYAVAWWLNAGYGNDHEPEFAGSSYLVYGEPQFLDLIYLHGNRSISTSNRSQTLSGSANTWYAIYPGIDQIRGGWWALRDRSLGAAFGDDARPERTYFNDNLKENLNAYTAWLAWLNGSTPNAFEHSINAPGWFEPPAHQINGEIFIDAYGTISSYLPWTMLHDPLAKKFLDQFAPMWNASCGHTVADFPAYPPGYACTMYIRQYAVANGGVDFSAQNSGAAYNTTDGRDFGSDEGNYAFTAGSGQVLLAGPGSCTSGAGGSTTQPGGVQLVAGDEVKNYNPAFYHGTGSSVDQLDPTVSYQIMAPIDNTAHTFHIKCPIGHAVTATCPTPGAAFTSFTRGGSPLTDSCFGLNLHSQFDDAGTFNFNYNTYAVQSLEALQVAGYNMSVAISNQAARFGTISNPSSPSRQLDSTVVVP